MSALLVRWAWTAYDHLGGLVGYNFLWSVFSLPWILAAYALLRIGFAAGGFVFVSSLILAWALVAGAPATAMLFAAAAAWARGADMDWRQALMVGRAFFWRALFLGTGLFAACALILGNLVFYRQLGGWLGALLGGLMVWFLLLVGLVAVFVFPVLVTQEGSAWATLRQSLLLAVDNLKYAVVFLLVAILFAGLGLASGLGLFCGAPMAWALFVSVGFRALLPKYTGETHPADVPRRLRELIRPWEA